MLKEPGRPGALTLEMQPSSREIPTLLQGHRPRHRACKWLPQGPRAQGAGLGLTPGGPPGSHTSHSRSKVTLNSLLKTVLCAAPKQWTTHAGRYPEVRGQQLQAGSPATLSRGPGGPAACKVPWNTKALLGLPASTCQDPGPVEHRAGLLWPPQHQGVSRPGPQLLINGNACPLLHSTRQGGVAIRPDPPTRGALNILLLPQDPHWALSQGLSRCRKGPGGPFGGWCPRWLPTYVTRPLQGTHLPHPEPD